jgi:NhaA family Na+:H+ antiporter
VLLGLLLGKPLGITLFARLAHRLPGSASRPATVSWGQIFGASWLCGIGFTMSLFIASLALGDGDLLDMSKIGTLAASIAAGCVGSLVLRTQLRPQPQVVIEVHFPIARADCQQG